MLELVILFYIPSIGLFVLKMQWTFNFWKFFLDKFLGSCQY